MLTEIKRPYADISEESAINDEDEVLFFMGFVWCIKSVDKIDENNWEILLKPSFDVNLPMTNQGNDSTCFTLGPILHELSECTEAIHFYNRIV